MGFNIASDAQQPREAVGPEWLLKGAVRRKTAVYPNFDSI